MTIWELLGGVSLTGVVQQTPTGIPVVIPPEFLNPTRRNDGPVLVYYVEKNSAKQAQIIHYDAPPVGADRDGMAVKSAVMIHSSHYHDYGVTDYQNMMSPIQANRELAEYEINRQTRNLKTRVSNLRVAATTMALAKGAIYADAKGNLLPDSTGAVFAIDFQVPAGNKNQLNWDGSGNIINAKWSDPSTDIPLHIQTLLDVALRHSGLPITTALYGKNIFKYLYNNDFVGKILLTDSGLANAFRNNSIPEGFLGIQKWIRVSGGVFKKADGTWGQIVDDDACIFTPDPSPLWWDFVEGSYVVPTNLSTITSEAQEQLSNLSTVYGFYSYAKLRDEPIGVRQIMGDTFMPMLNNNIAIFQAKVHW